MLNVTRRVTSNIGVKNLTYGEHNLEQKWNYQFSGIIFHNFRYVLSN